MRDLSRRSVLAGAAGSAALAALSPRAAFAATPAARSRALAAAGRVGERPDPTRPEGAPDPALPYEHVVVVMMENHSFDTYLGMLPTRGQPKADGFTFDGNGKPLNSNPVPGDKRNGRIRSFHLTSACQGDVSQSWDATHTQVNGGRMDGFVGSAGGPTNDTPMGYYDEEDLPFYYSLAKTFTLANRWFCSAPCQTYPNRRFLVAGTASGDISTDTASLMMPPPPSGTICDRLSDAGVSWANYFTDLPGTAVIPSNVTNHPQNYQPVAKFFADAAAGTLPSVSFVDPEFGVTSEVGADLDSYLLSNIPNLPPGIGANASSAGGDEESPQNVLNGQYFVAQVVDAVLNSPLWPKTLLIWTYDEHGGYYDHVPPPAAVVPDGVAPELAPSDAKGGYDRYGVRVPAVVVSPWSRKNDVTNVVHDHTSILATIEMKWNLSTLTARDAHAATLHDFLDLSNAVFLDPPELAAAQNPASSFGACSTADYHEAPFYPAAAGPGTDRTSGSAGGAPTGADGRTGALAFTGLDALVPVAGTALLGAAAIAARSVRRTEDDGS